MLKLGCRYALLIKLINRFPTQVGTILQRNLDKAAGLLNNGRRNVAGLLAQAAVAFELGDHAGALASYRNALEGVPGMPTRGAVQNPAP